MSNRLLVFLLFQLFSSYGLCQNLIEEYKISTEGTGSVIHVELVTGECIYLNTRFKENEIRSINSYGTEQFVLIQIEPKTSSDYIINASFKSKAGWVQDYQDRAYFRPSTGLTCTQITKFEIVDAQTIHVVHETTTSSDKFFRIETVLKLGKFGIYDAYEKSLHCLTIYGKGSAMAESVKHSPRVDYLNR